MEVEELLNLFDSYWFQSQLLRPKHPFSTTTPKLIPILESNKQILEKEEATSCTKAIAMHEVQERQGSIVHNEQILEAKITPLLESNEQILEPNKQNLESNEQILEKTSKLSRTPTFMVRSQSDQCLISKDYTFNSEKSQSPSPKSVLVEPKLQPILSGKEYNEFKFSSEAPESCIKDRETLGRRKKKSKNRTKSLSELEFEELKGFMDLGFEFSDKDKDSNLVTIIPGLRRLGRENDEMGFEENESGVARPHLSEAWAVLDEKKKMEGKKKNTLKSWRIDTDHFGNEMEIKDQLKLWAHSVASTVR